MKKTVRKKMTIEELFKMLNVDKQGEYKAPNSLKVKTTDGFKKVKALLKTQENPEWVVKTKNHEAVFTDYHRIETINKKDEFDVGKNWTFVKNLKKEDEVYTTSGKEKIVDVYFNGNYSKMYDLQVEETKSFLTNGFNSHNTLILGNYALNTLKQGKNALVYTFETSDTRLFQRYYSNLIGYSKKELLFDEDGAKEKIKNIKEQNGYGDLIVKEYNSNTVCSDDLMAHIYDLNMYKNWQPDIIIVDYILIMLANNKKLDPSNSYKYYKTVSEELRNIAKTLNVPVLSAVQINREGMADRGGSKADLGAKYISESRGVFDTVDWYASLVQTAKDKKNSKIQLQNNKSRNDQSDYRIEYEINYDSMLLQEGAIIA